MFRQLWVFHHWRRIKVYLQVSSKKATKQCRSFASITRGALKWSIIYYLTKPNGSNNNKGNEADVQDLPFLSTSRRAGAAATLSPQPDTTPTHALGEHSLVPPCVAAYCVFIPPLRTMWVPLSDTQELCPNGLISEGGIWIKLWLAQPQQHCQLCTSVDPSPDAPQSLIPLWVLKGTGRERGQKLEEGRFGRGWWEKHLGKMWRTYWWDALKEKFRTLPLLGTPCWLSPALSYRQLALLHWPVKTSILEEYRSFLYKLSCYGCQMNKKEWCYWADVTTCN